MEFYEKKQVDFKMWDKLNDYAGLSIARPRYDSTGHLTNVRLSRVETCFSRSEANNFVQSVANCYSL